MALVAGKFAFSLGKPLFRQLIHLLAAGSVAVLGLPKGITVLLGSASLMGGHGTTIAWAPLIETRFGLANATEIGIAAATLGLVVASVVGGRSPVF